LVEGAAGGFGTIGSGFGVTSDVVASLAAIARSSKNANVGALWMRTSHPVLVAVGTVLLVSSWPRARSTVAMVPGIATALGLGHTYDC